jgi:hypothetical protein
MALDKAALKAIREDMNTALSIVAQKHGLESFNIGNIRFSSDNFRCQLEATRKGGKSKEEASYDLRAVAFKLPPRGTLFTYGSKAYATHSLRGKYVVAARHGDGKLFRFPVLTVVDLCKTA